MKLDVNALRYLSREELRTLQAVELGQKNVRFNMAFLLTKLPACSARLVAVCVCVLLDSPPGCCWPQH